MTIKEKIIDALSKYTTKIKSIFVGYDDIVNNCTSTATDLPLSAAQGKYLKEHSDSQYNILNLNNGITTNGTLIPDNSNLNNYKTPGTYYVPYAANAATITNTPTTGMGYKLLVFETGYSAPNYIMQIAIVSSIAVYSRRFNNQDSTWSGWATFMRSSGATMTGDLTLQRTSTIASNTPAALNFKAIQSDNNTTSSAFIRVYDDHDTAASGTNMVIQCSGNMIIGGGESPSSFYNNYVKDRSIERGELAIITADSSVYLMTNCNTIANTVGASLSTGRSFYPVKMNVTDTTTLSGDNNVGSIGTSDYRWANGYINNLYNSDGWVMLAYSSTYADLYANIAKLSTAQPAVFHLATAAANAISDNKINGTFRGVVSKTSVSGTTYTCDFVGSSGAGGNIWTIRASLTSSGATITNIQRMVMPSTSLPLIKKVGYTYSYTSLAANTVLDITANDFGISTPSGYGVLGITTFYTGNKNVLTRNATNATGTSTVLSIRNVSSSATSGTAGVTFVYIRSEAISG